MEFSNLASYSRFLRIADKITADPALLAIPLANIARWLGNDHPSRRRLEQWREIIVKAQENAAGMVELLRLLRDDSEEARHLKSFSPFAGVLTSAERNETCGYAH